MNTSTKYSAQAPLAGYLFQCRLALLRGLQIVKTKANVQISIETFDDIAFENDDIAECLMQAKHSLTDKPLNDLSVDFWKTVRVWLSLLDDGIVQLSSLSLFFITTATAEGDTAVSKLRSGSTTDDKLQARDLLKAAASKSQNASIDDVRQKFLALSDPEIDLLLARVEVIDGHPNLVDTMDEIEGELLLLAPTKAPLAAQYLEGWWLDEIGRRLVDNTLHPIEAQSIVKRANDIGRMLGEDSLPIDDPKKIGAKTYGIEDENTNLVKQMRIIQAPDSSIRRGVNDFYRASAQKSKWARESLLIDGENQQYDERVFDIWARKFDEEVFLSDEGDEAKIAAGQKVFFWSMQQSVGFRNVVETWMTSGTFHALSDRSMIGWHPDYQRILQQEQEDA